MAKHKQIGISLLASVSVLLTAGTKRVIYTVPPGLAMIPTHLVWRNASADPSGATDIDVGDGALCDTWKQSVTLTTVNDTDQFFILESNNTMYDVFDAGDVFGAYVNTGAAGVTITADLFGYLIAV